MGSLPGNEAAWGMCHRSESILLASSNFGQRRLVIGGTQRQFSENICSEEDLKYRLFGTFFVKFLACLSLLAFSNI